MKRSEARSSSKQRIGIDARFYGPKGTGIGRTLVELLPRLEEIDSTNEYVVFLKKDNIELYQPKNPNFKKVVADIAWYSVAEQLLLPRIFAKEKLDLLHIPHINAPLFYRGKIVLTLHDLIISDFKTQKASSKNFLIYNLKHLGYRQVIARAVKKASRIMVPSQSVKLRLLENYNIPDKVQVIYEASDTGFNTSFPIDPGIDKQIRNEFKVTDSFILYVGNSFPHKNIPILLEAVAKLDPKTKLVLVTTHNKFSREINQLIGELKITDRVILPGYLADQDLKYLYRLATAFVFPSLAEGFGLPGLEAMASGLPLICSDIPVFKEIYGEAAIYFDPKDPTDLAARVEMVIKEKAVWQEHSKLGLIQAGKYSWDKFAQETHQVYLKEL
jgi:glycosyltransferase involved in cell wall biosynthesis